MTFEELNLPGAYRIGLERKEDNRGFFARTFCADEFQARGLETIWVQANTSFTLIKGTIRGMHFQRGVSAEAKLIRCVRGAVFDVLVDLRVGSTAWGQWVGTRLDSENRTQLYVPKGVAHGFQTLTDDVEMEYMHSMPYRPDAEGGLRYDDPDVAIAWPLAVTVISGRDAAHSALRELEMSP